MSAKAKTIQIFLPNGDPRGIRIAEITTRIVRVIEVPRSLLSDFLKMSESSGGAVYFLFGNGEDTVKPKAYIGQTGDVRQRLATHNNKKDFWERAVVMLSRADSLTITHSHYLERLCIQRAKEAGRYSIENDTDGNKLNTTKPLEAECEELLETGETLLATLGFPIFMAPVSPSDDASAEETYHCKAAGVDAQAKYTPEGMVILKGSKARLDVTDSFKKKSLFKKRQKLITAGMLVSEDGYYVFSEDYTMGSPSTAAALVVGNSINGWDAWKTKDGKTLDELKRQVPSQI